MVLIDSAVRRPHKATTTRHRRTSSMTTSRKKQKPTTTNRRSLFRYGFLSIAVLGGIVIPILLTHLHVRLQQEHVHRNAHLSLFAPITHHNNKKYHHKKIDTAKTIQSKDNTSRNRQQKSTVITGKIHDILHPAGTTTNTNTANFYNTTRRSNNDNTSDTTYDPLAFGRVIITEENNATTSKIIPSLPRYTVVMSFVDESYFPVFELWLQYYQQLGPIHAARRVLCFVALSDATYRRLQQFFGTFEDAEVHALGKTIVLVQPEADFPVTKTARSMLWIYRVRILDDVLRTYPQFDVVLTDLDALWLRDPHDLFHTPSGGGRLDIVASQAEYPRRCKLLRQAGVHHQLPTPEHNQRFIETGGPDGGAAVLGFIYFGNTAETQFLTQRLVDQTTDTKKNRDKPNFDDQFEFNCLLYHQYNLRSTTQLFRNSDRNKTNIDNNTNTNTEEEDGSYLLQYTHKAQNKKNNQPASTADNGPTTLSVRLLTGSQVLRYCDRKKERGGGGITKSTYVVHCYNKGRDYDTIVNVLNHTAGFSTRMQ